MRRIVTLLGVAGCAGLEWPASLTFLGNNGQNVTVYAQPASYTPTVPAAGTTNPIDLVFGGDGCTPSTPRAEAAPFALFVERGFCSFDDKMRSAVTLGAQVLVVADSLRGEYRYTGNESAATMGLSDPCAVNCAKGEGYVDARRLTTQQVLDGLSNNCGTSCASNACAFSGRHNATARQVCCFTDVSLDMALPSALANHSALPALFVSLSQATKLHAAMRTSGRTKVVIESMLHPGPRPDLSSLAILLLGSLTASIMSYLAASSQDDQDHGRDVPSAGGLSSEQESLSLTIPFALGFLCLASSFLILLYFLLQAGFDIVILLLVCVFVVASSTSISQGFVLPTLLHIAPARLHRVVLPMGRTIGLVPLLPTAAYAFSLCISCFWFFHRRSPWAWALQDALSASICLLFLRTMRLPSLRVASFLLFLMFFYDIFMVFISPLIFHSSVMMEVATAGQPSASIASGICERTEGERMPMLMMVPRMGSAGGRLRGEAASDYAMLGLGDIVLPGLLLTLARRYDLANSHRLLTPSTPAANGRGGCRPSSWPSCYWAVAAVAYTVGLCITLAANIYGITFNGVQGQPALLYLVPCTVGGVFLYSVCRNEMHQVWHGTPLLLMDVPKAGTPSEAEAQPFTTCCCDDNYDYDRYAPRTSTTDGVSLNKQL